MNCKNLWTTKRNEVIREKKCGKQMAKVNNDLATWRKMMMMMTICSGKRKLTGL